MPRSRKSVSKPRIQKIPVLDLPSIPFTAILNGLSVLDVINLSQCSTRITNAIIYSRPHNFASIPFSVTIKGNRAEVQLPLLKWYFCPPRDTFLADAIFVERRIGENTSLKVFKSPIRTGFPEDRWITPLRRESYEKEIIGLVKYLKMLFNCPIDRLLLCFKDGPYFGKLLRESTVLHKAQSISVEESLFLPEETKFMLENFDTDNLKFQGYSGQSFIYDKPVLASCVEIPCATWITDQPVLEMARTCKKLELRSAYRVTDQCINQLIQNWLASDGCELQTITITRKTQVFIANHGRGAPRIVPMRNADVLKDIETLPGARKRRDAAGYYNPYINYHTGRDIRRQDGVLATININTNEFHFTVWYTPNPNV